VRIRAAIWITALTLLLLAPVANAHHSTSMYDMEHPSTFKGVVTRVEWTNPHGYIYLNVKNEKGGEDEWAMEINSPNFLRHNGWTSTTVKPGDVITVNGGAAKSGAKTMRCTSVTLADGLELRS
jgi:DNA/RNA endonuclease YhcR with UshA esterase domain